MTIRKLFSLLTVMMILVFAVSLTAMPSQTGIDPATGERLPVYRTHNAAPITPHRDQPDEFMTYRFIYSSDGGMNWSDVMGTGDHGMHEIDVRGNVASAWGASSYDFGAIVDMDNMLHIVAVLNAYSDVDSLNPMEMVNGLYDVKTGLDGDATYTLIRAEGENENFYYSDVGMDGDGGLYAVWLNQTLVDEAPETGEIYVSKSTDGGANWSDPFMVVGELDPGINYPHCTPTVGDYLYIIYTQPNPDDPVNNPYHNFVAKVSADLSSSAVNSIGAASQVDYSYAVQSANPIVQDVANDAIFVTTRSNDLGGTVVGYSTDGENWDINTIPGEQRYPSLELDLANQVPYIFSNFGVPPDVETPHQNWMSFDEVGYGGGAWTDPMPMDSIAFDGTYFLLYCHNGIWTPNGSFVRGCNVWGDFTPDQYQVTHFDAENDAWSVPNTLWSIHGEENTFVGGYIVQNILLAGMEDYVFVVFTGKYGETDLTAPEVGDAMVSSAMLAEDKVVTVEVSDNDWVYQVMLNWRKSWFSFDWEWTDEPDSMTVDEEHNSGTYYFHLPNQVTDMDGNVVDLMPGDHVYFIVDCYDLSGNYGVEANEHIWWVDEAIDSAPDDELQPAKFALGVNYPNPFNSSTVIPFSLDRAGQVKVAIYDLMGRNIATLFDGVAGSGWHTASWNGGSQASGIYFYTLESASGKRIAKLTLLR